MSDVIVRKNFQLVLNEIDVKIVDCISNGYTFAEAAKTVGINKRTLEARLNKIRGQFDCVSVTQLACEFIRKGLIQ